jgi:hypothetical protein
VPEEPLSSVAEKHPSQIACGVRSNNRRNDGNLLLPERKLVRADRLLLKNTSDCGAAMNL